MPFSKVLVQFSILGESAHPPGFWFCLLKSVFSSCVTGHHALETILPFKNKEWEAAEVLAHLQLTGIWSTAWILLSGDRHASGLWLVLAMPSAVTRFKRVGGEEVVSRGKEGFWGFFCMQRSGRKAVARHMESYSRSQAPGFFSPSGISGPWWGALSGGSAGSSHRRATAVCSVKTVASFEVKGPWELWDIWCYQISEKGNWFNHLWLSFSQRVWRILFGNGGTLPPSLLFLADYEPELLTNGVNLDIREEPSPLPNAEERQEKDGYVAAMGGSFLVKWIDWCSVFLLSPSPPQGGEPPQRFCLLFLEPRLVAALVAHEKARCSPFLTLFRGLIQLFVWGASHLLGSFSLKVSVWCLTVCGRLRQICQWPLVCVTPANCDRKNRDLIDGRERKVLEEEWGIRRPTEHHYRGWGASLPRLRFLLLPHHELCRLFWWALLLSARCHCFDFFIYCISVEHWISCIWNLPRPLYWASLLPPASLWSPLSCPQA